MVLKMFQIDAFSNRIFGGNPAAVIPLDDWLDDEIMLNIAEENNLSETAFLVKRSQNQYDLRWFTPNKEVDLCGHATLASAHYLFESNSATKEIEFSTRSGILTVEALGHNAYLMEFPSDNPTKIDNTQEILDCLNIQGEVYEGKDDYIVVLQSQKEVEDCQPDFYAMKQLPKRGIIITAQSDSCHVVSRCFYPKYGIDEDPVTGSAHTLITPYWAIQLKRNQLNCKQLSKREGSLKCIYKGKKTTIIGSATTYLAGIIHL